MQDLVVDKQLSGVAEKVVPAGFKLTEVGVIPEDWEVKIINEIAKVYSGGTPNRKIAQYWDGDIPWVTTTLIDGNDISYVDEYITDNGLKNSSAKWCNKNTLLMAMYGQGKTRGKVGVLRIKATINQACAAISLYKKTSVKYLFHYLNSKYVEIRELSNSGGQENLSGTIIKNLPIPYPSDKERLIIADTLSDIDIFILAQERLLAKKQAIKTATMQQLLTGKTRLPQFALRKGGSVKGCKKSELGEIPEDWSIENFSTLATLRNERINPRTKDIEFLCIELEHIISEYGQLNGFTETSGTSSIKNVFSPNDILFGKLRSYLKKYWKATQSGVCSTEIWVLKTELHKAIPEFIFQTVKTDRFVQTASEAYGTHMPRADWKIIKELQVATPSIEEQTAITAILSDMDKDIQTLQQRLDKTRQLKQGMMQELLTGKTRLI